jgi:hypothetical protein
MDEIQRYFVAILESDSGKRICFGCQTKVGAETDWQLEAIAEQCSKTI